MRMSMDEHYPVQPPAAQSQYDLNHRGPLAAVPHDPYPMDGMTMLCRTGPSSDRSSPHTSARPSSRESHSDYSNPTSFSSQEPPSGKASPVKQEMAPAPTPEKRVLKKKSGFFQGHSPFRRKSTKEVQAPAQVGRNTWHVANPWRNGPMVCHGSPYTQKSVLTASFRSARQALSPSMQTRALLWVSARTCSRLRPPIRRGRGGELQSQKWTKMTQLLLPWQSSRKLTWASNLLCECQPTITTASLRRPLELRAGRRGRFLFPEATTRQRPAAERRLLRISTPLRFPGWVCHHQP